MHIFLGGFGFFIHIDQFYFFVNYLNNLPVNLRTSQILCEYFFQNEIMKASFLD